MKDLPFFNKMVIIGVGLIGGSLALACKREGIVSEIIGVGRREENLRKALELNAIDSYTFQAEKAVRDADLVVLATPVGSFIKLVEEMGPHLSSGAIITDVGSVKAPLMEIEDIIPPAVHFVGAHPIAGREKSGIGAASPDLFKNAKCILTPTEKTDRDSLERISSLWKAVGAVVSYMSPDRHDRVFAAVSHLPHVVAYALVNTLVEMEKAEDGVIAFSAGGFKDFTRIAASHPEMWRDICLMNRKNIIEMIDRYEEALKRLKTFMEDENGEGLYEAFMKAKDMRENI